MENLSNKGASNFDIEEIQPMGSHYDTGLDKLDWNAIIPKSAIRMEEQGITEDNFGYNFQEPKIAQEGNNGLMELSMQFPDVRFTPHLSFPTNNFNPDLFSPSQLQHFQHQFILLKPHFYPHFPTMEEPLMTVDQAMQSFMDPSVFNSQTKGKPKTGAKTSGKGKMKSDTKDKQMKEAKDPTSGKGK